ncbi:hypothetical protein I5I61_31940 [Pseudomonas nitroreducens]|uniref:DUF3077 domain-containing protein n=1 Tax=Pseudomonas nitroreducens TaxID=46680 RepID=A0ABS0KXP6_PSENT|nr:hypothetical protein [Pseudomonas nitroreducens]MBG6292085.1 hypothetical protein [Pseudomonas nitroreducens]
MQVENIKAQTQVQAIATGCNFLISSATGQPLLTVNPGHPVVEGLSISGRLLDGICSLLRRVTDDPDETVNPPELFAVQVALDAVLAIQVACRRGLESEEGEA